MNPGTGEIKYGAKEELRHEGFTEDLSDEEAKKLLKFAPDKRMEALKAMREARVRELERDVKRKEVALEQMKKEGSGKQTISKKKRDGRYTKLKQSESKKRKKRKAAKKSKQKNRGKK